MDVPEYTNIPRYKGVKKNGTPTGKIRTVHGEGGYYIEQIYRDEKDCLFWAPIPNVKLEDLQDFSQPEPIGD